MERRYPGETDGIFRISNSSLQTYLMCGLRFFLDEEAKHRRTTVAMAIGTAVAYAAEIDNDLKASSLASSESNLVQLAEFAYKRETGEAEVIASKIDVMNGEAAALEATRAYWRDISPKITNPIVNEEKMIAVISDGIELAGTPDCLEPLIIRDLKTGQPWTKKRVDRSRQFTGYDLLHESRYGQPARRIAVDSVSRERTGPRWKGETIWSARTERDREAFVETVERAVGGIQAGVAIPAPDCAWYCAGPWCQHWADGCTARPGA